ncbi:MAG: hypothetical protein V4590_13250 [Bacteroidota bacterium]
MKGMSLRPQVERPDSCWTKQLVSNIPPQLPSAIPLRGAQATYPSCMFGESIPTRNKQPVTRNHSPPAVTFGHSTSWSSGNSSQPAINNSQ